LLIQRAFVQVSSIGFAVGNVGLPDGTPPTVDTSVRICVKNHGSTRGINFAVKASLNISPGNRSTMLSPPVVYDIPPGTEIGITFDAFNRWLDDDAIAVLKQGRTSLDFSFNGSYADNFWWGSRTSCRGDSAKLDASRMGNQDSPKYLKSRQRKNLH